MAGDWIKMRTDLLTSPKVVRMASALKADRFRIAGGLLSVWSLFDVHSTDGMLSGYTLETVDDLAAWPGFSAAMVAVEWMIQDGESLVIPRFEAHNGASAKRRAQDSDRKREVRKMSASDADKTRTREEKRREEKKEHSSSTDDAPADLKDPAVKIPYDEILDSFQARLPGFPQPRRPLADDRRKAVRMIWTQEEKFGSVDFFDRYFKYVSESEFLGSFKGCGFDWLMKKANFRKVCEGNYHGGSNV